MHSALALQVDALSISIKQKRLLDNVSTKLNNGQVLAIIGPNGAGKTSFLRAVAGDFNSYSGAIIIGDQDRQQWAKRELACHLASLSQQSPLNFPFSVRDVVSMSRLPHSSGADKDRDIIALVMEKLDVSHLTSAIYTHLSGGEKQRVQLARVIAQLYPLDNSVIKLLLLDEPCTGLDLKHQKTLAEYIIELRQAGVSVVMSAHDINWAAASSDQFLALKEGCVLAQGSESDVMQESILKDLFDVSLQINSQNPTGKLSVSLT